MVTNDLGACEWFVWDLRRSGLIDRGQLDQVVNEFMKKNPRAEAPALAQYLVQHGTLTQFQAERVLNGKTAGLVLGPYVLLDAIGQGSMGQVYKASSKNDSNFYAVKVLPRRSMWNVRLARRQVRSFGNFQHPAVVPFVDVGTAGGLHYLAWPLVEGKSLEAMIAQEGKLSPEQTALIGMQVAQGLTITHQNNLFHGLLKPSNVMVSPENQAKILDFGIGSLLVENEGESLVDTMSTANTMTSGLDYCSPECIMEPSNRTPAGDQYSLGCMLYCCLTGRVPFPEGSAVEKMMAHQTKEPDSILDFAPETPERMVEIIQRLMAKTPGERFHSCEEIVEALEPFIGEMAVAQQSRPQAATNAKASFGMNSRSAAFAAAPAAAAVSTPAPVSRAPAAARQSLGFDSGSGMSNRALSSGRSGGVPIGVSGGAPVASTPLPNAPKRTAGLVPSRANFQLPEIADLPNNDFGPGPGPEPIGLLPTGGSNANTEPKFVPNDQDKSGRQFGTFGMVVVALLIGSLAFLAFKLAFPNQIPQ
ncbi:MAG: serine/threonine-protein kinase [Gemmataceae bacterium]